ncbi:lysozyme inhibitor LprI family protein [Parvibaculum sp.]|uniref:lysozyme inhibitor LprI family protein n=1 Tax=Parvibaculum sp. TaxID=2024848 RepID=UPI002D0D9D88|nr:lysozyme inhibitor LprI family protein [Parvibaculum sp.]HUD51295.1 lysozyme inhibitor LprI family protein [Parvibaculum sp.]
MRISPAVLALLACAAGFAAGFPAHAAGSEEDCTAKETHVDTAACLTGRAATEQQALADAMKRVKERIAGIADDARRVQVSAALDQAQQSWGAYRDAQCGMEQELDPAGTQSSSAKRLMCEVDVTRRRVEVLSELAARIAPAGQPALSENLPTD